MVVLWGGPRTQITTSASGALLLDAQFEGCVGLVWPMAYVQANRTGALDFVCERNLVAVQLAQVVEVGLPAHELVLPGLSAAISTYQEVNYARASTSPRYARAPLVLKYALCAKRISYGRIVENDVFSSVDYKPPRTALYSHERERK